MRVTVTVIGLLGLAVVYLGWQLKVAWGDLGEARQANAQMAEVIRDQERQIGSLNDQFDALGQVLTGLEQDNQKTREQLQKTLDEFRNVTKTEEDSDASIACLDVPVPVQLDLGLR